MSERKWLGKSMGNRNYDETFYDRHLTKCGLLGLSPLWLSIYQYGEPGIYLNRAQVRALIRHAERWLETGRLR